MEADRPIQTLREDRFGRGPFARRIAQVVGTRDKAGLVIGIHAPWGDGKTSVLNMIVEELKKRDDVLVIPFNPWRFPEEAQLLRAFFVDVARKIDASLETRGEKLSSIANDYADVLSAIPVAGDAATKIFKTWTGKRSNIDIDNLKSRFEKGLEQSSKRVVIIMDDIDRLDKTEVQTVFKLVKLLADFPNTTYILSFDDKRVAEALGENYGPGGGRNFLEKIIQVPLSLPPTSRHARRDLAFEGLEASLSLAKVKLTEDQQHRIGDIFDKAFLNRITTPRLAKRFGNALSFALPLLVGEVDIVDLIFLEAIRTFYPELYASIRDNEEAFLGSVFDALSPMNEKEAKAHVEGVIKGALSSYSEQDQKAASMVVQDLFPRTGATGLFRAGAYSSDFNEGWAKEKRVAAKDYFSRYFNYGVPSDDISDLEIERFLQGIPGKDVNHLVDEFKELCANNRGRVLIEKLRRREDELPADAAAILALVVALSGNQFAYSHPVDRFFGLATYSQAGALIRHLLHRIEDQSNRERLAIEIATLIEPLPLAFDYFGWLRRMKRSHYSEEMVSVVSEECEQRIRKLIVDRIATFAEIAPIERTYPLDAQQFYQLWATVDKENLREYLKRRTEAHPSEVAELISAAKGVDPNSETDNDWTEDLGWFDFICDLIPVPIILSALKETYPQLESAEYQFLESKPMNAKERAARWFQRLHDQKSAAVKSSDEEQSGPDNVLVPIG